MWAEVKPHTLREVAEQYEAAIVWVASIGFPVSRGRVDEYRRTITELSRDFPTPGWGDLDNTEHRERVCTTLLEIRELISIHRGLAPISEISATQSFKHYVKGPFSSTSESAHNASNRPRNIGFELYLNALFAYAGLLPKYGTNADLEFTHEGTTFFIEAKRPTTANAAESLISDANNQLTKRLNSLRNHQANGLIALDLTKVINPDGKVMSVFNEGHLYSLMHNEDKRQIANLSQYWHRGRHSRTVGALLHYRMLTNFVPNGDLNTLKWIGFVQFREDQKLNAISSKLEAVIQTMC